MKKEKIKIEKIGFEVELLIRFSGIENLMTLH